MRSSNLFQYVQPFFEQLEVFEDIYRGHCYKNYLVSTVEEFLKDETEERAFNVFRAFFDVYRIHVPDNKESFVDLIDVLHQFEEHAALLVDKQRDHLVHSVNVFLTGLAVYGNNQYFKSIFLSAVPEREYHYAYSTNNEEFFYRWGLASLLHDIGYPVEISYNQINRFLKQTQIQGEPISLTALLSLRGFEEYNQILRLLPEEDFAAVFRKAYPDLTDIDPYKPTDLMAAYVHLRHKVPLNAIRDALDNQVDTMGESGFVDHGFFSALIFLRWYGVMIQRNNYKPDYFFWPVLDAASAILLHNYYKNGLQKVPFMLGPMSPKSHPIAFLLVLCDELQEWNREARGILTKSLVAAESIHLGELTDHLYINFITKEGHLPDGFCDSKKELLAKVLDISAIFPKGLDIENSAIGQWGHIEAAHDQRTPRPLLENVEKLAIAIHALYNDEQRRLHPDYSIQYPLFSDLPPALQYSNIRQAISIFEKVNLLGFRLTKDSNVEGIRFFPSDVVEILAREEHKEWMKERVASGWRLGEKNNKRKTTPYLRPYDDLTEEAKEVCRVSVRYIPLLLERIGYRLLKHDREELSR